MRNIIIMITMKVIIFYEDEKCNSNAGAAVTEAGYHDPRSRLFGYNFVTGAPRREGKCYLTKQW